MEAIKIQGLTKAFGQLTAVDNATLDIREGELFGLLGPNGAGKTTLISMLSTMLKPTSGSASVWGHDIDKEMDEVRRSIGIVFQDTSLDFELTGRENMDLHGRLYGLGREQRDKAIKELLGLVDLEDKADVLVKNYSGGMKRRLEIARGLMHKPRVLFLDEPTLGLDPQTRRRIWEHIKALNNEGVTVILTTHYLEEADFLCDRIAIIDHGRIIALDTPKKLKDTIGGDVIILQTSNNEKLKGILQGSSWVREAKVFDSSLSLSVSHGEKVIPKLISCASRRKIRIDSVSLKKPTLEDVFIHYTGRAIREESADPKDLMRQRLQVGGR